MIVSDIERALIEGQMQSDTRWCYRCSLYGMKKEAAGLAVIDSSKMFLCEPCFRQQIVDGIALNSFEPVAQPMYISLLRQLLAKSIAIVLLALCAASCEPLTAPTQRNPDGSPHIPGSPLQPWINSDVQTGNFTLLPVSR